MATMININSQEHPFRISFRALRNFELQQKKSFMALNGQFTMDDMLVLFTEGFRSGQLSAGAKEPTITRETVEIWLDDNMGLIKILSDEMMNQISAFQVVDSDDPEGAEKKNQGSGN